jgi:hypothetical protein
MMATTSFMNAFPLFSSPDEALDLIHLVEPLATILKRPGLQEACRGLNPRETSHAGCPMHSPFG